MTSMIKMILAGLLALGATAAHAETIHSVTQVNYNFRSQPVCTVTRMNPAVYGSLPTDACALGTEGTAGPDRITKSTYNAAGELTQVDQAYGTSVQRAYARYWYNANGTRLYEIDARSYTTQYAYDGFDRLKRIYYPCPVTQNCANGTDYEEYGYDNNDNKTSHRRRDGNVIYYSYDNLNRETVRDIPGGTAQDVYSGYDGLGRLTFKRFVSTGGSGVSYSYDGLGRVSSTTDMNGRTVSYLHNSANARTRMLFPDGNYIDYDRDNASRLKSFGWNANSGLYSHTYNSLGQLVTEIKGGGGVSYGYDGIGRLNSFTNNFNGTANDINWSFGYNPASQLVSNVSSTDIYDYEELSSITEPAQTHDGLNRISTLVGATGACPSGGYDARANLICDGTGRSYTYDIENRLLTGNIGGNTLSLTYDPEGRLASYTWNGGTTSFLYDGVNLIGEYNSSSQLLRRYVHGPGTDNPVVWYEGSGNGTLRYLYTNQQGSVIATADSSGNRGDIYAYGAYGEPKDQYGFTYWPTIGTGSTSVSRFGYTGQMFLADARLYYYKARIYDPQMGRFLQTDPIGSEDDLNLYAYVGGDPVNLTDSTGECPMCVGAGVGAGLDYGIQVAGNLASGQDIGQALTDVDWGSVAVSGAMGAVGGIGGGQALVTGAKGLNIVTKGLIGEGVARIGIALRGEKIVASGGKQAAKNIKGLEFTKGAAGRSKPDFVVVDKKGNLKIVEAKFGSAKLSGPQKALRAAIGEKNFRVARTSYDDVAKVGAAGGGGAAGATCGGRSYAPCQVEQ